VIQIVVNRDDVQGYAAKTVFEVHNNRFGAVGFTVTQEKKSILLQQPV